MVDSNHGGDYFATHQHLFQSDYAFERAISSYPRASDYIYENCRYPSCPPAIKGAYIISPKDVKVDLYGSNYYLPCIMKLPQPDI
jgi:hypothetical protein